MSYIKDSFRIIQELNRFFVFVQRQDERLSGVVSDMISFSDSNGYLQMEEGYKPSVAEVAKRELRYKEWKESWIGTGKIAACVSRAIDKASNLVFSNQKINIKNRLNPSNIEFRPEAERVLFELYRGVNEKQAFEMAVKTFGAKYDTIAFLFFIKDSERFLPISSSNFDESFSKLDIDFKTSNHCSWENYNQFLAIIREIQEIMNDSLALKTPARLIDAHSFVWIIRGEYYKSWQPSEKDIDTIQQLDPETATSAKDYLTKFINEKLSENAEYEKTVAIPFVDKFLSDFPADKIMDIPLERFLFSPKGTGYENSFCYRLMYSPLASMGQCFPSIFGIYLKEGRSYIVSPTFKKKYGEDYHTAFSEIKRQIVDLFESAKIDDYNGIKRNPLNSAFKGILLSIYFSKQFLPAPTKTALNAYCNAVNVATDTSADMFVRNHALVEWKNSVPECATWSNFMLMRFCDWLWRSSYTINGGGYTTSRFIVEERKIEKETGHLEGETREAVVKIRVNQTEFRERLLKRYGKCCLCGVSDERLLVASHIKPWAASEPGEKLDPDNGFLLCPNHDKLFDQGFISFDENGKILISDEIQETDKLFMNINENMTVSLTPRNKEYLTYHRDHIFKHTENKQAIKKACKGDWTTYEMPSQCAKFEMQRHFSNEEMEILRIGNVPEGMDDKWFWYMDSNTLFAYRSWTGLCIFILTFEENSDTIHVTVNRDPEQYLGTDIAEDMELLNKLLDWWSQPRYDY